MGRTRSLVPALLIIGPDVLHVPEAASGFSGRDEPVRFHIPPDQPEAILGTLALLEGFGNGSRRADAFPDPRSVGAVGRGKIPRETDEQGPS